MLSIIDVMSFTFEALTEIALMVSDMRLTSAALDLQKHVVSHPHCQFAAKHRGTATPLQ